MVEEKYVEKAIMLIVDDRKDPGLDEQEVRKMWNGKKNYKKVDIHIIK